MSTLSTLYTFSALSVFRVGLILAGLSSPMLLLPAHSQVQTVPSGPAASSSSSAATDFAERLEKVVKDLNAKREDLHVPGAALVIVKDDKIVLIQGLGQRDMAQNLLVTPKTLLLSALPPKRSPP